MRVAVIGAGYAGLVAAHRLVAGGAEVTVFEARDRVGGRAWTTPLGRHGRIERGAEFIEPEHTTVRALAAELGLDLHRKGMAYGDREPRGGIGVDKATLAKGVAALEKAVHKSDGAVPSTAAALLDGVRMADGAREAIRARIEVSFASDLELIDARAFGKTGAGFDAHESESIAEGNDAVPWAIALRLGRSVHLGSPVRRIAWSESSGRVVTDGGEHEVDAVVVAVPASVLDRIEFEPVLPPDIRAAHGAVVYGQAAKLFVPLLAPEDTGAWLSVPERFWSWTARVPGGNVQQVAHCFAGSPAALTTLGVAHGPERWLDALARLRPDLELDRDAAVLQRWDDDPWVGGAYSVYAASQSDADRELLTARAGPIQFAGEHTAGIWSATMEGAARSGLRAAEAILAEPAA